MIPQTAFLAAAAQQGGSTSPLFLGATINENVGSGAQLWEAPTPPVGTLLDGDLLVVLSWIPGTDQVYDYGIHPSGWTQLSRFVGSTTDKEMTMACHYRFCTADDEGDTYVPAAYGSRGTDFNFSEVSYVAAFRYAGTPTAKSNSYATYLSHGDYIMMNTGLTLGNQKNDLLLSYVCSRDLNDTQFFPLRWKPWSTFNSSTNWDVPNSYLRGEDDSNADQDEFAAAVKLLTEEDQATDKWWVTVDPDWTSIEAVRNWASSVLIPAA